MKKILKKVKKIIKDKELRRKGKLDESGNEVISSKPMSVPVQYQNQPTLEDKIRRMIRVEASLAAQAMEKETFEEADDFDVGDDYDPTSPYELDFDSETDMGVNQGFIEEQPIDQAQSSQDKPQQNEVENASVNSEVQKEGN